MIKRKKIQHPIEPLLPVLRERLRENPSVLFAYLFGSYGKGTAGPLSDVDIALYLDESEKRTNFTDERLNLLDLANRVLRTDEVDLIILNEAPLSLKFQVLKTGQLLFSKDQTTRVHFETSVFDQYMDHEPLRYRNWRGLAARLKEGKFGYGRSYNKALGKVKGVSPPS
jgi:predicted nucleotidyltransferase